MNCKPGDLAIVVRGVRVDSENAGKIVRVVSFHSNNPRLGVLWNIKLMRPTMIGAYSRGIKPVGNLRLLAECQCADDWLRPLPGELGDEEINATESVSFTEPVPA